MFWFLLYNGSEQRQRPLERRRINCPSHHPPGHQRRRISSGKRPTTRASRRARDRLPPLLKSSIRDNDPVFFLENTILYGEKGEVPADPYLIPLGLADVKRAGTDLTIVTYGRCVLHSLAAAAILEKEHEVSVEVVDLRTIRPLDIDTVLASVAKTHRVLIVEEQKPFASVGSQLAYMIQREAFDELDGPIHRLAMNAPAIYSPPIETEQLQPQRVRGRAGRVACASRNAEETETRSCGVPRSPRLNPSHRRLTPRRHAQHHRNDSRPNGGRW